LTHTHPDNSSIELPIHLPSLGTQKRAFIMDFYESLMAVPSILARQYGIAWQAIDLPQGT